MNTFRHLTIERNAEGMPIVRTKAELDAEKLAAWEAMQGEREF